MISLLGGRLAREMRVCGRKFERVNRVAMETKAMLLRQLAVYLQVY